MGIKEEIMERSSISINEELDLPDDLKKEFYNEISPRLIKGKETKEDIEWLRKNVVPKSKGLYKIIIDALLKRNK